MPRTDSVPFELRVARHALLDATNYISAARHAADAGAYKRACDAARTAKAALDRAIDAWTETETEADTPADPLPA